MADISDTHIWLNNVGGSRAKGERGLYLGRCGDRKIKVRIFADGTYGPGQHTDVFMTEAQARQLAVWLVRHLLEVKP